MSGSLLFSVLWAVAGPPLVAGLWWLLRRPYDFLKGWMWAAIGLTVGETVSRQWMLCAIAAGNAILAAVLWWLSRRRRKRAGEALGAKSRALRDALVRRAREAAKPRPVLRPVPGGVR